TQPTTHRRQPTLEDLWNSPRLTGVEVARITDGVHRVDDGLYLQVKSGRSWIHRYQFRGKARWSGLGSAREVTLAEARAARDRERRLIREGIDPVAAKRALATYLEAMAVSP